MQDLKIWNILMHTISKKFDPIQERQVLRQVAFSFCMEETDFIQGAIYAQCNLSGDASDGRGHLRSAAKFQ